MVAAAWERAVDQDIKDVDDTARIQQSASSGDPEPGFRFSRGDVILTISVVVMLCLFGAAVQTGIIAPTNVVELFFKLQMDDIDRPPPGGADTFNLVLRVDNYNSIDLCRENTTATVLYGGNTVVAWTDSPVTFCARRTASTEIQLPLYYAGATALPDRLRKRMASEKRSGNLEFTVTMRMLFPKGRVGLDCTGVSVCASRQYFVQCTVKQGEPYAPTPCGQFALGAVTLLQTLGPAH
jgi:hypothetical protein